MIRVLLAVGILASALDAACPGGIPAAEVKAILKSHNVLRSTISKGKFVARGVHFPPANKTIADLTWDCELEKSAQNVSDQCRWEHSKNRNNVGENMYLKHPSDTKNGLGKAASDAWKFEFQASFYGWGLVWFTADQFSTNIRHATQMAWAATTNIGCGITLCSGGGIVTCHYKEAGNVVNALVYPPNYPKENTPEPSIAIL